MVWQYLPELVRNCSSAVLRKRSLAPVSDMSKFSLILSVQYPPLLPLDVGGPKYQFSVQWPLEVSQSLAIAAEQRCLCTFQSKFFFHYLQLLLSSLGSDFILGKTGTKFTLSWSVVYIILKLF